MNNKYFQIKTLFVFVVIIFVGCNKEPENTKTNTLEPKEYGGQTYLTEIPIEETTKTKRQWKREAEQYLKMKEGDTMEVYNNKSQQYSSQDNTEVESYEPFVDVKPLSEAERKEQLNRKIIKERYYIENPNHTWRRVSKREYLGY